MIYFSKKVQSELQLSLNDGVVKMIYSLLELVVRLFLKYMSLSLQYNTTLKVINRIITIGGDSSKHCAGERR